MTKRDYIALADQIREWNSQVVPIVGEQHRFTSSQVSMLADFCGSRSARFDRGRWFDYILREEVTPEPPEAEPDGTEGWRVPEPEPPERPDPPRAANGRWGQPETAEPPAEREPEMPTTEVTWLGTTPENHPQWGEDPNERED